MKNSDTFLPAPVKIAVNSVFDVILRHSAQPVPEIWPQKNEGREANFRPLSFLRGLFLGYNFSYLAYRRVSVAEGLQRYCTSVESLVW